MEHRTRIQNLHTQKNYIFIQKILKFHYSNKPPKIQLDASVFFFHKSKHIYKKRPLTIFRRLDDDWWMQRIEFSYFTLITTNEQLLITPRCVLIHQWPLLLPRSYTCFWFLYVKWKAANWLLNWKWLRVITVTLL